MIHHYVYGPMLELVLTYISITIYMSAPTSIDLVI